MTLRWLLVFLTADWLSVSAAAQTLVRADYPFGAGDMYLLARKGVQKDLHLSAAQIQRVQWLVKDIIDNYEEFRDAGSRGRAGWFEEALKVHGRNEKIARSILTPEQGQRLKEVTYQYLVTVAFWNAKTRGLLAITDQQFSRIEAVPYATLPADERNDELARIRSDFNDYPKRSDRDWQFREWKRLAVLTPEQRRMWKEMLGRPFKESIPSDICVPATGDARNEALRFERVAAKASEPSIGR